MCVCLAGWWRRQCGTGGGAVWPQDIKRQKQYEFTCQRDRRFVFICTLKSESVAAFPTLYVYILASEEKEKKRQGKNMSRLTRLAKYTRKIENNSLKGVCTNYTGR